RSQKPFEPGVFLMASANAISSEKCLVGERNGFRWYHLDAPASPALDELAQAYHLHELAVEDCRVPGTRAKIDEYGDTLFVVVNIVRFDKELDECSFSELDFFLKDNLVISVCDGPNPVVDQIRAVFLAGDRLANSGRLFHRLT